MKTIILGGGCFWCTEAVFRLISGVTNVTVGYAGGDVKDPTYEDVCTGTTGHAEVSQVDYDPEKVSLEKLLDTFFVSHDPTSLNRQGNDVGTQYRSAIYWTDEDQKEAVEKYIAEKQKEYTQPIVTEVKKLDVFYPAEEYHQRYFEKNPNQAYCQAVIAPKVNKIMESRVISHKSLNRKL